MIQIISSIIEHNPLLKRVLKKSDKPPRPDTLVGTPLFGKEGKILIYSTINFSSFLRRSTLTEASGGGGLLFRQPQLIIPH
jgi:hypothetical protein